MTYSNQIGVRRNKKNDGFTLLEMMVVLVLVSLITVLLMQGFSFVVSLQERIRQQLVLIQNIELREQWFRLVVRSYHRGRDADNDSFTGESDVFSGLALQPLNGQIGMPTNITWRINNEQKRSILTYQEAQYEPVEVMSWTSEKPEFRYIDADGEVSKSWPPDELNVSASDVFQNRSASALPKGVVIIDTNEEYALFWYVSISSNTPPEVDFAL
ncbi:PulJ/GspJ family protein [Alteromonas oceanisediminis]|uniref:PulJ/GspJ family protein n=1 Tax=Alteromonas oceanisediminis TaxID=2836180 RepID=UPI001BDB4E2A|nr:type II secretion system protein [Alteromonas oceanisediminis]MBT0585048.1 type II secretion system GspH family protein [Alteromonas oceanisediminis]